ncbi:MAG: hypothetical protein WAK10_04250, partial [Methanoregula sp.]
IKILLVLGALITIILLFIDIYLAGIVCIIFIILLMSMLIMQDSQGIPDIRSALKEDAKAILLTNKGNAKAVKIHAILVPADVEFDIPVLEVESTFEFPLTTMVEEIKIIITFQNENKRQFSRSVKLSALEEEPDLLKPMIPLFKWK